MGNSIRCRRRVPHEQINVVNAPNIPNNNNINLDEDEVIEWLLVPPQANNDAVNAVNNAVNVVQLNNQQLVVENRRIGLFRFRKAVKKIQSLLRIRYLWARIGHMLTQNRTFRRHTTRRHDVLNSVWQALRPLTWRYAQLFSHLRRTGGVLRYHVR